MTLDDFMAALERTPRDWRLDPDGSIRRPGKPCDECPISAVGGGLNWEYGGAAEKLGIPLSVANEIAWAADSDFLHDAELRARLLQACGLAPLSPDRR